MTRYTLADNTHAYAKRVDYNVSLMPTFRTMSLAVPLFKFTYYKSIFDNATGPSRLPQLRWNINIFETRRAYRENKIANVACIRSNQNIADNLVQANSINSFKTTLGTGRIVFIIEQ